MWWLVNWMNFVGLLVRVFCLFFFSEYRRIVTVAHHFSLFITHEREKVHARESACVCAYGCSRGCVCVCVCVCVRARTRKYAHA